MESLNGEIISVVILILSVALGFLAKYTISFLEKKGVVAQIENHKEIAKIVVNGIEQTYRHLHGQEKLNLAKIEIIKLAKTKGVKVSEKELDLLIESSVREMNKSIKEVLKK